MFREDEPCSDKVVIEETFPARPFLSFLPAHHRLQLRNFANLYAFLVQDFHHSRLLAARRRLFMPEDIAKRVFAVWFIASPSSHQKVSKTLFCVLHANMRRQVAVGSERCSYEQSHVLAVCKTPLCVCVFHANMRQNMGRQLLPQSQNIALTSKTMFPVT